MITFSNVLNINNWFLHFVSTVRQVLTFTTINVIRLFHFALYKFPILVKDVWLDIIYNELPTKYATLIQNYVIMLIWMEIVYHAALVPSFKMVSAFLTSQKNLSSAQYLIKWLKSANNVQRTFSIAIDAKYASTKIQIAYPLIKIIA